MSVCDIIELSSDSSESSNEANKNKVDEVPIVVFDSDLSESEFPVVNFNEINAKKSEKVVEDEDKAYEEKKRKPKKIRATTSAVRDHLVVSSSSEESDTEVLFIAKRNKVENNGKKSAVEGPVVNHPDNILKTLQILLYGKKSEKVVEDEDKAYEEKKIRATTSAVRDYLVSSSSEESDTEDLSTAKRNKVENNGKKIGNANDPQNKKALKELAARNRKDNQPDNILKSIIIMLDAGIEKLDFFGRILDRQLKFDFDMEECLIPYSITWKQLRKTNFINDFNQVQTLVEKVDVKHAIIIWSGKDTILRVANENFFSEIEQIKSLFKDRKIVIVIYKIEKYFKHWLRKDAEDISGKGKQKMSRIEAEINSLGIPRIMKTDLEDCIIKAQLFLNVDCLQVDDTDEMILLINQSTRSLAERDLKLAKSQNTELQMYLQSDHRDTVRVDNNGNGLKRLWQQQLCQFPSLSLEIAEAITSVIKTPLQLIETYAKCTQEEGEKLLKDIPIRRAAGLLTATRRIGPELSKKIYDMFTAKDGDIIIHE